VKIGTETISDLKKLLNDRKAVSCYLIWTDRFDGINQWCANSHTADIFVCYPSKNMEAPV
jgi:hypothetical protein